MAQEAIALFYASFLRQNGGMLIPHVIVRSQNYFHLLEPSYCDAAICLSGCVCMRLLLRNYHFLSASFFHAPRNGYYNRLSIFKGNKAFIKVSACNVGNGKLKRLISNIQFSPGFK
jgi:hypothetical protein